MYSRTDTLWLYRYYSGDACKDIAAPLFRNSKVVHERIRAMKMPQRPRGAFTAKVRERWLAEPHIKQLRKLFEPKRETKAQLEVELLNGNGVNSSRRKRQGFEKTGVYTRIGV